MSLESKTQKVLYIGVQGLSVQMLLSPTDSLEDSGEDSQVDRFPSL